MRIAPCDDPGVVNQSRTPVHRGFRPDWAGLRPLDQHPRDDRFPPEGRLDFAGAVASGGCRTPPPTSVRLPTVSRSVVDSGAGWVPGETGSGGRRGGRGGRYGPSGAGWESRHRPARTGARGKRPDTARPPLRPERRPAPRQPPRGARHGVLPPTAPAGREPGPNAGMPWLRRPVRPGYAPPARHRAPSSPRRGQAPTSGPTGRSAHRQARRGSPLRRPAPAYRRPDAPPARPTARPVHRPTGSPTERPT